MQNLKDSLKQIPKVSSTVLEFGPKFKAMCDQFSAICHPVIEINKSHWFLYGLGPSFETFSTDHRAIRP